MFSHALSTALLVLITMLISAAHATQLRGNINYSDTSADESSSVISSFSSTSSTNSSSSRDLDVNVPSSTFDCYLYEMDGLEPPGIEIPEMWNCEVEPSATEQGKQYTFIGDVEAVIKRVFHEDAEVVGATRMTVPYDAVRANSSLIDINHPGITMSHDRLRSRRNLAQRTGAQRLLIVRAIDKDGISPNHWKQHLRDDFFQDGNNLKTRMSECSNGLLNIIPATGTDVTHGVLNIRFNDISFATMSWQDVGTKINTRLENMNINYATRIFLLPDIVEFDGAAAWAQVGGNTIWLKDQYASYPIVQVHEYGHLLGQRHSGANGNSYSDNSCYMGNQVPWTDEGAFMCFNPAKTWYFGWYSANHKELSPKTEAFNGDIVGIDDVVNQKAGNTKVIIKINGDSNEFFLMYNRAKGINREVIGGADEVVITRQNGSSKDSNFEKSLGTGEQWVYNNFANTGKNLVVKNCYTKRNTPNGDTSRVLVYVQGLNDQQCGSGGGSTGGGSTGGGSTGGGSTGGGSTGGGSTGGGGGGQTGTCSNKNWTDIYGDNCSWYATNNRCSILGDVTGTNNWTASEACCVCGGGNRGGGNRAGGSSGGGTCTTDHSWYDSGGPKYSCEWYKTTPNACTLFGSKYSNFGKTAKQACCVCK